MCAEVVFSVRLRVWLKVGFRVGFRYLRVGNAVCEQEFVFGVGFVVWCRLGLR